jgi:hypothetical protein
VKLGFFVDQDTTRYACLRLRRLKEATRDPRILDALSQELDVADAGGRKKLSAIERRIDELRAAPASLWQGVPALEVMAASIWNARRISAEPVDQIFRAVPRVQDLSQPLGSWLDLAGLEPHVGGLPEIPGANLIGYRPGRFVSSPRVVAVAALNDPAGVEPALAGLKRSRALTSAVYLACTPAVGAAFLWAEASRPGRRRWDAEALRRPVQEAGCGLLLIEGDAVAQAVLPQERAPDKAALAQLALAIQTSKRP